MALVDQEYPINEAAVEAISAQVQAYLTKLNKERRDIQRIRLTVEELLLNIMGSPNRSNNRRTI